MIEPRSGYNFSAWVKSNLVEGARAWLQIEAITLDRSDCVKFRKSREIVGVGDWQRVEVAIVPQHPEAFVVVSFQLEGAGKVWFDDIALLGHPKSFDHATVM
jgi:hypothetical protein